MRKPLSNLFKRYSHKVGLPPETLVYVGDERPEPIQINLIDYNESYFDKCEVEMQWGYPVVLSFIGLIGITMFIFLK